MTNNELQEPTADKILAAATELFARHNYASTSLKDIARLSGFNSALISYYFGGKKNLYLEVLNKQSTLFLDLIGQVRHQQLTPVEKLHLYVSEIAHLQEQKPMQVHLIYRELLTPSGFCEGFVKSRLYKIHRFMFELVEAGLADGSIKSKVEPTHVAFTLESIIVFFFLTQDFVKDFTQNIGDNSEHYLKNTLNSYLTSLTR